MSTENKSIHEAVTHLNCIKKNLIHILNEIVITVNEEENALEVDEFTIHKNAYDLDFKVTDEITKRSCFQSSLQNCLLHVLKIITPPPGQPRLNTTARQQLRKDMNLHNHCNE